MTKRVCSDCERLFEKIIMEPLWDENWREIRWVCPDCLDEYALVPDD